MEVPLPEEEDRGTPTGYGGGRGGRRVREGLRGTFTLLIRTRPRLKVYNS